jgi:hypothetical protein
VNLQPGQREVDHPVAIVKRQRPAARFQVDLNRLRRLSNGHGKAVFDRAENFKVRRGLPSGGRFSHDAEED